MSRASGGHGSCRALELVARAEGDGALGPPERVHGLELAEDCVHLASKLLEDALRGWGLVVYKVLAKPLRFELWGAHEDLSLSKHALNLAAISKLAR